MRGKLLGMIAGTALLLLGGCEGMTGDGKPKLGDILIVMDDDRDRVPTIMKDGRTFEKVNVGTKVEYINEANENESRVKILEGEFKDQIGWINARFLRPAP